MLKAQHPMLRSAFRLLSERGLLALVLGRTDLLEHDALCVALVCRPFRNDIFELCPRPPGGGPRLTTRLERGNSSLGRLHWAKNLSAPPQWLACWGKLTCKALALGGNLVGLQWAREGGCPWDIGNCGIAAARGGHLGVLVWLRAQGAMLKDTYACCEAAKGGHLNVLQWLRAQEPPCHWATSTCAKAATGGHLGLLQWALVIATWKCTAW